VTQPDAKPTESNDMNFINRRHFLSTAAVGAAALTTLELRATEARKLRLGLIGCGGYGATLLNAAFRVGNVEVTALCDVDGAHLSATAGRLEKQQGKPPRTFKLYQDLLAVEELDAVLIATPPQWHALPFLAALERGLDIYCEKPLAYDVREGRAMVNAAAKTDRIVQIGFQRRNGPAVRAVRDYLQSGRAGRVVQVEAQINYNAERRDATPQSPPETLDWDLWCGPAPKLPYSPQIGHVAWRLEKEYGHGHLVDWGIHWLDAIRWILGESTPRHVQAAGGIYELRGHITTPDVLAAHFGFVTCPVVWRHRIYGAAEYAPEISNGIFFYAEKETIFVADNRWVVIPKRQDAQRQVHEASADIAKEHMANFLECVRTRQQTLCPTADGYQSTTTVQLGALAYETESKLVWDATKDQIMVNSAAAVLLKREYRAPYQHPWKG